MRKYLLSILLALALCFPCSAQVFIEQGKVQLTVQPGQTITGFLNLHNTSGENLKVKLYWEDFLYQPPYDGSKKFFPPGTTEGSCAQWVNFNPREINFAPFSRQEVSYIINVPPGARGGYYGVLFAEKNFPEQQPGTGIRVISRVGSLFFIETDNRSKAVKIDQLAVSKQGISGEFINEGDVILIPYIVYYVMDKEGSVFDRGELNGKIYLPPQKSASFNLEFNKDFSPGEYTAVMTFDLQEGDVVVKEVDFKKSASGLQISNIRD